MTKSEFKELVSTFLGYRVDKYRAHEISSDVFHHVERYGLQDYLRSTTIGRLADICNELRNAVKEHIWKNAELIEDKLQDRE